MGVAAAAAAAAEVATRASLLVFVGEIKSSACVGCNTANKTAPSRT